MSTESDLRTCKVCGKTKKYIYVKHFNNAKDKKYVDESGSQWNGRTCPDCHKHIIKINKRNKLNNVP